MAHEALHNVFQLIDPKFLTLKQANVALDDTNSLGMSTYRNLLSFGYWKKLVYLTQSLTGLDLCYKFYNVEHFKMIKDNFIDSDSISND